MTNLDALLDVVLGKSVDLDNPPPMLALCRGRALRMPSLVRVALAF